MLVSIDKNNKKSRPNLKFFTQKDRLFSKQAILVILQSDYQFVSSSYKPVYELDEPCVIPTVWRVALIPSPTVESVIPVIVFPTSLVNDAVSSRSPDAALVDFPFILADLFC